MKGWMWKNWEKMTFSAGKEFDRKEKKKMNQYLACIKAEYVREVRFAAHPEQMDNQMTADNKELVLETVEAETPTRAIQIAAGHAGVDTGVVCVHTLMQTSDSRTTSAAFEPERVLLTEHGLSLVSHSANFREAEQLYMITPPDENGYATIATDKKGSVFCQMHMDNFTIMD